MTTRKTPWDLSHLSVKYPWLRVDDETIEEFRAPFEWRDAVAEEVEEEEEEEENDVERQSQFSDNDESVSPDERRGQAAALERAASLRFSLKDTRHRRSLSLGATRGRKRRLPRSTRQRELIKAREEALRLVRLENEVSVSETPAFDQVADIPSIETPLPPVSVTLDPALRTEVFSDFKRLQDDRSLAKAQRKARAKKATHSVLSLRPKDAVVARPHASNNTDSLAQQLQALANEQRRLSERVAKQIEAEKARLPLTFLFERQLDKSYCRQKSVETITATFGKLQHRLLFHAFDRWRTVDAALRKAAARAAALESSKRRAVAFFERLASDAYVGTLDRAWRRWRDTARILRDHERHVCATKIQALYRRRRAAALLRELKQAALDREYRRSVEIQQLLRFELYGAAMKWSTLRNGFDLLLQNQSARRLQFFFRRVRVHVRALRRLRRRRSAVAIQRVARGRQARDELQRRRVALELRRDRERRASVEIQRQTRGFLARQRAAAKRRVLATRQHAARKLQRCWRRYRDRVALNARFVERRRLLDAESARRAELARIEAARRDEALRHRHATQMQRMARGFLGRRAAARARMAQRLDRAARRVQANWHRSRGRYALHLRFVAQRERLDARREAAALRIQCGVRCFFARRLRTSLQKQAERRRASAVAIQRVARGRQGRRHLARARRATVMIQSAIRGRLARQERARRVTQRLEEERRRYEAAGLLQRVARGHRARRLTAQRRDERRRLDALVQQSAVLIQKRARGMEARRVAQLLLQARRVLDRQQQRRYAFSTQELVNATPLLRLLSSPLAINPATDEDASRAELIARLTAQIRDAEREMQREDAAVVLLQRHFRGYRTRVQFVVLCVQRAERLALEQRMALRLTRVARGFLARRRVRRLRQTLKAEELKAAYLRERRRKDQEREWEERLRHEQMALQLQRLQLLEREIRDAKRDAEVATWQRQAAQARKEELAAALEAKRLERALRRVERGREEDDEEEDGEEEEEDDENEPGNAWEQVMDAYGNWYYYNAQTGESAWEMPRKEEKPKKEKKLKAEEKKEEAKSAKKDEARKTGTKDEASMKKVKPDETGKQHDSSAPSTPSAAPPANSNDAVPEGVCCRCRSAEAAKRCLDCLDPSRRLFCVPCFTQEHGLLDPTGLTAGKTRHDFVVLRPARAPARCQSPQCATADALACYYCAACEREPPVSSSPSSRAPHFFCETCFPLVHESAQRASHLSRSDGSVLHFRTGSLLCSACLQALALRQCEQCDEPYCAPCFTELHASASAASALSNHEFSPLDIVKEPLTSERDAYCSVCEIRRAASLCNLCGDPFCAACFSAAHAKGQKARHTTIPWAQFAQHGDWLEIQDDKSGGVIYFNVETKESTDTKPFVLKSGDERHQLMALEREQAAKRQVQELESRVVALQLQVAAMEKEKEAQRPLSRALRATTPTPGDAEPVDSKKKKAKKKKGWLARLVGRRAERDADAKDPLTVEQRRRLELEQGITPEERALLDATLKTRARAEREALEQRTIGTALFEQSMVQQLADHK
ncbi:hypothetical protein ATCC90586_005956 [Pythium insidiosum]|nr:hypothetical protein ATCC90586_005956 [Pythium insidiosum]